MPNRQPTRSVGQTNCIALDLGETAIRVVEMELAGSGASASSRVLKRGSAPLPAHAWQDIAQHRDAFVFAIKSAMSGAGISGRSVVACMPRRLVTVRFARLPSAPPDQMKSMVMFEAQQYILFSLDEVVLDFHSLNGPLPGFGGTDADDLENVLLVAARRSLVNDILGIFDKAALELRQLSVSALALAEHARDMLEPTALVDIQPGSMDVAVVADGRLLFTRATALDLEGISPEVAQRKLDEEIARSFTAYQNEFRNKILSHVYLSGSSATVRDAGRLEQSLGAILEMPISRLNNRLITSGDSEIIGYATAVGMALQTQANGLVPISLVPDERAERKARQSKRLKQQISVVGAAALICLAVWKANGMLQEKARMDHLTLAANNTLIATKASLAIVQKKHDKLVAFDTELSKGLDRRHPTIDVVVALHSALPPTAELWLSQLTYVRGGVLTLRGESKNSTAPTELTLALQSCGAFRDVKLGYMGDAQETNLVAAPPTAPVGPAAGSTVPTTTTPLPTFGTAPPAGGIPNFSPSGGGQPNFPAGGGQPNFNPGGGAQPRFTPGGGGQPGFTPGGGGQPNFIPGNAQPSQIIPGPSGEPVPIFITPALVPPAASGKAAAPAGKILIQPDPIAPTTAAPVKSESPTKHPRQRSQPTNVGGVQATKYVKRSVPSSPVVVKQKTGVTLPPSASSVSVGKTNKPTTTKIPSNAKVTRTSFIITCKVNQNSVDLLSGINLTQHKVNQVSPVKPITKKPVGSAGSDNSDNSGDSDAN